MHWHKRLFARNETGNVPEADGACQRQLASREATLAAEAKVADVPTSLATSWCESAMQLDSIVATVPGPERKQHSMDLYFKLASLGVLPTNKYTLTWLSMFVGFYSYSCERSKTS
jgi:hypothetical protein